MKAQLFDFRKCTCSNTCPVQPERTFSVKDSGVNEFQCESEIMSLVWHDMRVYVNMAVLTGGTFFRSFTQTPREHKHDFTLTKPTISSVIYFSGVQS